MIDTYKSELSEDNKYMDETDTRDQPLRRPASQPTQSGNRSTTHVHEAPDGNAENTYSRCLRRENQKAHRLAAADADIIAHSWRLHRKDQSARCSAAAIKESNQVPPAAAAAAPAPLPGCGVTRGQGKTSADALTASAADPFTYTEAMEIPQWDHWERGMQDESTSILLNNTLSALNSREAQQLQVKLIGSKWVYKTKHNPDGSTQYKARLVIMWYEEMDYVETSAPVGKRPTLQYLISLIGRYGRNMAHLDVLTTFLPPEIDDDDICMLSPERLPQGLNSPEIIVRPRNAPYGLKQPPQLWHDNINAFLLCLWFTQASADPNLCFRSDIILIILYFHEICISYPEAASKALIEVNVKLLETYRITNLITACQLLNIEIYYDCTGISLEQQAYITTNFRW